MLLETLPRCAEGYAVWIWVGDRIVMTAVALGLALGSLLCFAAAIRSLTQRRPLLGTASGLVGVAVLACASTLAALAVSVQGYQALTHEALAATLRTRPLGEQIFAAELELPDGTRQQFQIEGDQLYVDARILKWKSWANLLGLHTAYRLDRIGGRYALLSDEQSRPRSLHALAPERTLDAFTLRQEHLWLAPLVDAEYGSATFIAADAPASFELRVSTTGLLIRELARPTAAAGWPLRSRAR